MDASLRARLGPRVRLKAVDLFSGTSAAFFLSVAPNGSIQTVTAVQLLMRCGVPASKGKAAIERLLETGSTALDVPSAPKDLPERLSPLGILAIRREATAVDVAAIREKLRMTQEEFAAAYGLTVATVRNWEQHRSEPDAAARAFLKVIDKHPEIAAEAVTV